MASQPTTTRAADTRPRRAMTELVYDVRFNTPAFLGNAEQIGQWRTPAFKSLLRHWWRVAVVANEVGDPNVEQLRKREAELFGAAGSVAADNQRSTAGNVRSGQSKVSLRLHHWSGGTLDAAKWRGNEFGSLQTGSKQSVRADVYLGFGPVQPVSKRDGRAQPGLLGNAIDPLQANRLTIRCAASAPDLKALSDGLQLAAWFGTMGSRARNGWGSLSLSGAPEASVLHAVPTTDLLQPWVRPLQQCLKADWATAIGSDAQGPLVWFGPSFKEDWRACVNFLAHVRKQVRLSAVAYGESGLLSASHVVGFPLTNSKSVWKSEERIPNSIRFKVVRGELGLVPLVAHLPVRVPEAYREKLNSADKRWLQDNEQQIWSNVHKRLDGFQLLQNKLTRIGR